MALFVYGGSFNPPHLAHVLAVCAARALAGPLFEGALVVPTFQHAFGKPLAPYADRVAMTEAAFLGVPDVVVSRIEEELGGESRTVRTLRELKRRAPASELRLLVGADILHERDKWADFATVERLAPLFVLGRQGVNGTDAPRALLPELSSTEVRQLAAARAWDELAARVPAGVLAYLRAHPDLYAVPAGA